MSKTLKEWKEYADSRVSTPDIVFKILKDWEEQNEKLVERVKKIAWELYLRDLRD